MPPGTEPALPEHTYLNHTRGIWSWLTTNDHKRVGVMFLWMTLVCFLLGGIFAMVIRLEHLTPGPTVVSALGYDRLFTLHGVTMVWLFMIPAIPSGFGNFLLPIMIGAEDVAFPRINLATVYLFALGAAITLWGMIAGGADTGWTFYTPYSVTTTTQVLPVLLGIFVVGFSTILSGLNFIVTVHTMRAPGVTWMKLPLFVWTIYGTAIIQTLATPVLGMVLALVGVERFAGVGIFNPALGGDPVLFQHLFWFYSHPAVYIMVLPGMGVISEVICAYAHKNMFSYKAIVISTLGIAFVGFFAWGHHLFVAGMSKVDVGAFGALSMFVGIFTAIKIFTWTLTLYKGQVAFKTPLLYASGFMFFLMFGGMTGVALATTSVDLHWHDTYFVVAHVHFIMVGAVIMAFLAAFHYWFPKLCGRLYPEGLAMGTAALIIFGFIATFLPQFLLGNAGMPRRYYEYAPRFQMLNVASSAGASLLAIGLVGVAAYLLWSLKYGKVAGQNPWRSRGYEWRVPSPPPKHNFERLEPYLLRPHDYSAPSSPEVRPEVRDVA